MTRLRSSRLLCGPADATQTDLSVHSPRPSVYSASLRYLLIFCLLVFCFTLITPFSIHAQPAKNQNVTRTRRPNPLQELLNRAEKAIAENRFADAIAALEEFLKDEPNDAYAHFHLGYAQTSLEQWNKAVASYRRAAQLKPDLAAAHLNLGLLLYEHESPQASIEPLRRAAELLANEARPHFLLGTALERSGRHAEAVAEFRAAAALDAKDADTQVALGRALLNDRKFAEAETIFRGLLSLDGGNSAARLGLAHCLLAQKKLAEAVPELQAYVAAVPSNPDGWLQLIAVLIETESYDQALAAIDQAEAAQCCPGELLRSRAGIFLFQKRTDDAIAAFRRLLEREPNNAELHGRLGRLLLEKRDFPAAERALVASLQLDAKQLDPLRDLVSVYYLAEKYDAALRTMDRLAQRETPSAFFWFIRATCYDKLLLKAEAVAAYEKFLALDEGRSQTQGIQARARVRTLKRELQNKR